MDNEALLVIDMQAGLFGKSTPIHKADELLSNINSLIDAFHGNGLPVFFIRHTNASSLAANTDEWQLHKSLHVQASDVLLNKSVSNSFKEKAILSALKERNIKSVVVTGLVTHGCIKAACLGALELGYAVTLAADGHSSYNADAAELIEQWNGKLAGEGAAVLPTADIIRNIEK